MKITVLVENISHDDALAQQFGFSALVEYGGRRILFDTGMDDAFARNARQLGVDLEAVDLCVISHAHDDHAGGLETFFACNDHAPVYLKEEAKGAYYASYDGEDHYAGVDRSLFDRYPQRFQFDREDALLFPGCHLITGFGHRDNYGVLDARLMMETPQGLAPDAFRHEQALVLEHPRGLVLISGCSHNGIGNILDSVEQRFSQPLYAVMGGFHLGGPPEFSTLNTTPQEISRLGRRLLSGCTGPVYTCHCTGIPPYQILKDTMGDRLGYLETGAVLAL